MHRTFTYYKKMKPFLDSLLALEWPYEFKRMTFIFSIFFLFAASRCYLTYSVSFLFFQLKLDCTFYHISIISNLVGSFGYPSMLICMNILNAVPLFGHTQIYLTSPPFLGAFRMFLCVCVFHYKNAIQSTHIQKSSFT